MKKLQNTAGFIFDYSDMLAAYPHMNVVEVDKNNKVVSGQIIDSTATVVEVEPIGHAEEGLPELTEVEVAKPKKDAPKKKKKEKEVAPATDDFNVDDL